MSVSTLVPGESVRRDVLARFRTAAPGAVDGPMYAPAHAAVAFVWVVDGRWVLRARADGPTAAARLLDEQALLARVRPLLPYALPLLLPPDDGGPPFVRAAGLLWTVHAALPGAVRWPWQALEQALDADRRRLVRLLRDLHDRTRGRLGAGDVGGVVRTARAHAARFDETLGATTRKRLDKAFARVMYNAVNFEEADLAFVHGDFHYGNVLLDEQGDVSGLVDLDGCRVAHPLEDLGYTAMMLVRRTDGGPARLADLDRIWAWYGAPAELRILYPDYVLFYALFDVALFEDAVNLPDRERYVRLQRELLDELARET